MKCDEKSFVWKSEFAQNEKKKYNYERVSVWYEKSKLSFT